VVIDYADWRARNFSKQGADWIAEIARKFGMALQPTCPRGADKSVYPIYVADIKRW